MVYEDIIRAVGFELINFSDLDGKSKDILMEAICVRLIKLEGDD